MTTLTLDAMRTLHGAVFPRRRRGAYCGLLAAGENFPFVADEKVTARRPRTGRGG